MSYRINLIPSEHTFIAEANESILEAALRAGVNLSYNCNSGSCGDCKAKVIVGEYEAIHHADYVLTEAEKAEQQLLLCSIAATSDMIIEVSEALGVQDIELQQLVAKIAKLEPKGDEHLVLHVRTPRSKSLRFLAGQSVKVTLANGLTETLAVASCPCNGMLLQFHLRKNSESEFYQYAFNTLQASEQITIDGPYGDFTLDESSERSLVIVAQDTGFAPMKSIIEHAIALDRPQSMQLFWIADNDAGHYQSNYCRAWEDVFDVFVYIPMTFNHKSSTVDSLAHQVVVRSPIESEMDLYLSCDNQVNAAIKEIFLQRGTPKSRIFEAGGIKG